MFAIDVRTNIAEVKRSLQKLHDSQLPYAINNALNVTALQVKNKERASILTTFDRPTPWTQNAIFMQSAVRSRPTATVYLKDSSARRPHYLIPQIEGGQRPYKRFEALLRQVLAIPDGYYAVPGSAAKLDQYGNMSRGQIVQILSYFQAFSMSGFSANMTTAGRAKLAKSTKRKQGFEYFVGSPAHGRLPLGVWQRFHFAHGSAIKPILVFVNRAVYRKRWDFYGIGDAVVRANFNANLAQSMTDVLRANGGAA